jgi:hypothetical protein
MKLLYLVGSQVGATFGVADSQNDSASEIDLDRLSVFAKNMIGFTELDYFAD